MSRWVPDKNPFRDPLYPFLGFSRPLGLGWEDLSKIAFFKRGLKTYNQTQLAESFNLVPISSKMDFSMTIYGQKINLT